VGCKVSVSGNSRYQKSITHLEAAERRIPLGAQTVSKSRLTLTPGLAPLFGNLAVGCRIWDIDGNEYVDLINSLAAVTLGYSDPEINEAVIAQVPRGTGISLSHPIELEVAEKICSLVPSAEMVRFGKNGSDATSAAIRVARAYTGRDNVIVCGYHGWHDWYIGTTPRGLGVPKNVSDLADPVPYNDLATVEELLKATPTAAMILEPMNTTWPEPGYLEGLRNLCDKYGSLLIFDETITGFRFAKGGAQEYFGVLPDLSTFGKGLANGYPLSAVTGGKKYMMMLERVFFSGTFGGELLSLTAANVVLDRVMNTDVISKISNIGKSINERIEPLIESNGLSEFLKLQGHPSWEFLLWDEKLGDQVDSLKTLFMQEMSKSGVLMLATHNVSAALDNSALDTITHAYKEALPLVSSAISNGTTDGLLEIDSVQKRLSVR
jgi:glutamate-1-semialdehyde 2,1-aminomutase